MITVKATQDDGRVVLWEIHPLHESDANPTGEVWISGNGREHEVGETTQVKRLIAGGQLVKVGEAQPAQSNSWSSTPSDDWKGMPVEETQRPQVAPAAPKPVDKTPRFVTDKPKPSGKAE